MLVLRRRIGETILINENIRIKVLGIELGRVKLGIEAPDDVKVVREELMFDTPFLKVQVSKGEEVNVI